MRRCAIGEPTVQELTFWGCWGQTDTGPWEAVMWCPPEQAGCWGRHGGQRGVLSDCCSGTSVLTREDVGADAEGLCAQETGTLAGWLGPWCTE